MQHNELDANLFPRGERDFDLFDSEEVHSGSIIHHTANEDGVDLTFRRGLMRIMSVDDDTLRLLVTSRRSVEAPPSFAVVESSPAVAAPPVAAPPVAAPTVDDTDSMVVVRSGALTLALDPESGAFSLGPAVGSSAQRRDGPRRLATTPEAAFRWSSAGIALDFAVGTAAPIYGLGEKTGYLNRRGRTYQMWNSDDPTHLPSRDPLYQSIPFFFLPVGDGWAGVFVDAPGRSWFDCGERREEVLTAAVEDAPLDAYVFIGDSPAEVVQRYVGLTGRPPMPPLWSLGYHQSRHTYTPAERVEEIAQELRRRELPADVIHIDIKYMDGYRIFTWDPATFRNPRALMDRLAELDFHAVTIVDPGVKVDPDYEVYTSGLALNAFCRTETGEVYAGRVWPGTAVFPDFSKPEVQEWWGAHHQELFGVGVAGIWNDMNEPADFTGDFYNRTAFTPPSTVTMDGDGRPRSKDAYHNVYGMLMCRATRRGAELARPGRRPFVLTRAGYAGIQRYAAVWTGDNHSWWEHLAASIPMLLGLGLSGVGFAGADVGGFQENPTPELFARWLQCAAFTPFFRNHANSVTKDQEPWSYGAEVEAISRKYLQLRYRLLPYIYQLFREHSTNGTPVMRPLLWHYPEDERVRNLNSEFLLGESLLIAPITEPGVSARAVYLPAGRWQDFWTGEVRNGPGNVLVDAPLDRIPLFVKLPAILPMIPAVQSTRAFHEVSLELWLFDGAGKAGAGTAARNAAGTAATEGVAAPGSTAASGGPDVHLTYYEDDGETLRHEAGDFDLYEITWRRESRSMTVTPTERGFAGRSGGWRLVRPFGSAETTATLRRSGEESTELGSVRPDGSFAFEIGRPDSDLEVTLSRRR
jgi:alpha-glucosidase